METQPLKPKGTAGNHQVTRPIPPTFGSVYDLKIQRSKQRAFGVCRETEALNHVALKLLGHGPSVCFEAPCRTFVSPRLLHQAKVRVPQDAAHGHGDPEPLLLIVRNDDPRCSQHRKDKQRTKTQLFLVSVSSSSAALVPLNLGTSATDALPLTQT